MKLVSMTDFVLELCEDTGGSYGWAISQSWEITVNYAKFLKQPLELWMFVPCGEDGEELKYCKECYESRNL